MEFVEHDGERLNTVLVTCSFIEINGKKKSVINKPDVHTRCACSSKGIHAEGKYHTDENVIKYSKGLLYLYDTNKNLLGVYKFSKNREANSKTFGIMSSGTRRNLMRFYLKRGCYISVFEENDKTYIQCDEDDAVCVVKKHSLGSDTVYVTEKGCKLQVSDKRNSKWNGIPIGRID